MSGGAPPSPSVFRHPVDPATPRLLMPLARALAWVNSAVVALGMVALVVASAVLTSSVVSRYFLKASTDWQDEAAVFCLVGATFMCGAFVQAIRGHVGIEAVVAVLSPRANRLRMALVDLMSLAFCAFFAWKSWTLLHEAWVDGQTTSSSWAPPLWIPYGLMSVGMTLLTLQLLVQVTASVRRAAGMAGAH
ncbi:MAG: TRAP transporter small permease subunit [Proteobacteria bacterium]|nr:TRAP transporter small permease subunit [Pseudomonadota bacterium]